jgi:hypothetical protein
MSRIRNNRERSSRVPGELLESLALSQLGPLLYERLLELGPALEHLPLLGLDILAGVVLRLDQLISERLQRLDLLLHVN